MAGDGVEVSQINDALNAIGDRSINCLATDPLLCRRIKIESLYETAVSDQEEDAFMLRSEEALIIPDDIDYLEYFSRQIIYS